MTVNFNTLAKLKIRKFNKGEEAEIWSVFYNTIHHINSCHYTPDQVKAWAPVDLDKDIWLKKIREILPYVAVEAGKIVGYADLQQSGYIDHFFCHHEHQRKGVGSTLFSFLETEASLLGITELSADVSITAKPFFESKGFSVFKEQLVAIRGQKLVHYKMVCKYGDS